MKSAFTKSIYALSMAILLSLPQFSFGQAVEEQPSALAMTGDLVIARPFLFAMTVLGTVTYVIALPFTLAGGNSKEAADTLVVGPAAATFVRCLGCTKVGRKKEVQVAHAETE